MMTSMQPRGERGGRGGEENVKYLDGITMTKSCINPDVNAETSYANAETKAGLVNLV